MAAQYKLWRNTLTQQVFRVGDDGTRKVLVTSQAAMDVDTYFTGPIAEASTSDLRAWLNSIPTA